MSNIQRLNIEKYNRKLILNKPSDIADFEGLSFDVKVGEGTHDLIIAFIFSLAEFDKLLKMVIEKDMLNPNGMLYFVYPKKGNKQYKQYIGRDDFFGIVDMNNQGYVGDSNIKFNKMAAFSVVFTVIGLKHDITRKTSSKPSQSVSDYVQYVPDLQRYLATNHEVLTLYNNLTPGYQRDWARYVYSAQTDATRQKRLMEMASILKQGYRSKDLYRQNKK